METLIDWEDQWKSHCPNYSDGLARIPLPNGEIVYLKPGPGFGDFSHPTTQLMMELMPHYVLGKSIFDIGCGSGILSIAAAKMGASRISCIDIDPDALEHTEANAELNEVQLEYPPESNGVVLMNMISSEQENAWVANQLPFEILITSGVLVEDRQIYLQFANEQDWALIEQREKEGWLGLAFKEKL